MQKEKLYAQLIKKEKNAQLVNKRKNYMHNLRKIKNLCA
jgi:hypothetical protein